MHEEWLLPYIPKEGRQAIDIGSATGNWTHVLANRFKYVIAIDPVQRIPLFQDYDNITFIQAALWSEKCQREFSIGPDLNHTSTVFTEGNFVNYAKPTERKLIKCTTLDSLLLVPDFIKIDTEGAEVEILKGAAYTLSKHPGMLIEIHGRENGKEIRKMLEGSYAITEIPNPEGNEENYWLSMH